MLSKLFRDRADSSEIPRAAGDETGLADQRLRGWVLHPFLLGAFPVLSLFSHNVYELPLDTLWIPLGVALGGTSLVWLILRLVTRDPLRAGMVVSTLIVLFFGYESLQSQLDTIWYYLNKFWVNRDTRFAPGVTLTIEALLAFAAWRLLFRKIRRPEVWTSYLNAFTLILVALPTVGLVSSRVREPGGIHRDGALPALSGKGWTPDIYLIILDGYARSDVMKEIYGFDNKPFIDRLERRGFFVARQSVSNYCQTQLSLASTLNADYLDQLLEPGTHDTLALSDLIKKNRVADQLRSRGYRTISFATGFEPTEMPDADEYLAPGPGHSPFNDMLLSMTPLSPIFADARWNDRFSESRARTLYTLDRLPSIARIPGPTFTFAHILSPHPPFLFGPNGEDVSPRQFTPGWEINHNVTDARNGKPEYVKRSYRNQASFLTDRVDRAIDQILKQSSEPPVIILQSDHGAWLNYHPNDAEATDLRERFSTLNAILIPGKPKIEGLNDQALSVNTFRIVLNNVFGTTMPLLGSRSYFSTVLEPLELIDITERLHSEKERTRKFEPSKQYLGLMQQF